jgi:hypothetical protein
MYRRGATSVTPKLRSSMFQAHIAVTPTGKYRRILERHIADAQDHVSSIDEHVEQLRPHDPLRNVLGGVRDFAGQATRVARLPFDVAMAVPAGVLWGRRRATECQLLKNAEDEYAITALALATCRAGESFAQEADDAVGAELLGSIRRHDEELLQTLGGSLAEHAAAAVAASNGGRSAERVGSTGAAQAVRAVWSCLGETVAGAIRWLPGVNRMWRELKGGRGSGGRAADSRLRRTDRRRGHRPAAAPGPGRAGHDRGL